MDVSFVVSFPSVVATSGRFAFSHVNVMASPDPENIEIVLAATALFQTPKPFFSTARGRSSTSRWHSLSLPPGLESLAPLRFKFFFFTSSGIFQ